MAKVVIIGGGSLGFAGGLTRDILSYEATRDAEFVYVDIDPKHPKASHEQQHTESSLKRCWQS
jgi:alpha-galactosidase/6-phospho-beta-glucosidase family protein